MGKDPPEPDIEKLLADLRSGDDYLRKLAAETIDEQNIRDDRIIEALKNIASQDSNRIVKQTAITTLLDLGIIVSPQESLPVNESPPVVELSRNEKIRDFAIGFLGWYIINGALWLIINPGPLNEGSFANGLLGCITFPLNIIALIIFAAIKRTRWIAFGILCALALNLVISLIIGMSLNGWCFIPFYIK
jgi:hypothetical protein